jgi:hypothetical protein
MSALANQILEIMEYEISVKQDRIVDQINSIENAVHSISDIFEDDKLDPSDQRVKIQTLCENIYTKLLRSKQILNDLAERSKINSHEFINNIISDAVAEAKKENDLLKAEIDLLRSSKASVPSHP